MGLIKILGIFLGIYVLFKVLVRFVLPWFLKRTIQTVANRFEEQHRGKAAGRKVYEDGEVIIRKPAAHKANPPDPGDEYIDFEEVKE